jgi:hypothetical protein
MALKVWIGGAATVQRLITLTLGSPSVGSTYSVTRNAKAITYVAVSTDPVAETLGLQTALSSSPEGEFQEIQWAANASTVTATGPDDGRPVELTTSAGGAGSPTLTPANSVGAGIAGDGPHNWNNAGNWSPSGVPANTDDVIVGSAGVAVFYGLDQSARTFASLTVLTNTAGLPERNTRAGGAGFREYLQTYLKCAVSNTVAVGTPDGRGPVRFKFDANGSAPAVSVFGSGQSADANVPAVLIKGLGVAGTLNVAAGSVGLAWLPGETSSMNSVGVGSGSAGTRAGTATLSVGPLCKPTTVRATGGQLTLAGGATTLDTDGASVTVSGGGCDTVSVGNGRLTWNCPDSLNVILHVRSGGVADFSPNVQAKAVAACKLYGGGSIQDPEGVVGWVTGVQTVQCNLDKDATLNVGKNRTYTIT